MIPPAPQTERIQDIIGRKLARRMSLNSRVPYPGVMKPENISLTFREVDLVLAALGAPRQRQPPLKEDGTPFVTGCEDCGLPYQEFPLDMTLPDADWQRIHPAGVGGLLCAQCIVRRSACVDGCVAIRAYLDCGAALAAARSPGETPVSTNTPVLAPHSPQVVEASADPRIDKPLRDRPALEALVTEWQRQAEMHRAYAARYPSEPSIGRTAHDRATLLARCALELAAILQGRP